MTSGNKSSILLIHNLFFLYLKASMLQSAMIIKHQHPFIYLKKIFFSICGTLHSVDQYLNIKLTDISVTDPDKYPHMV